jgi:hypothetical protein
MFVGDKNAKGCVYTPHSLQELTDNVQREIVIFQNELCCVLKNIFMWCDTCLEGRGQHF